MSDRFRDLEESGKVGRKDAVLLATVSSFEGMARPTRNDLQQFTDLFLPLFSAASDDARRTASAALSRCANVPEAVARLIMEQPVGIAAPFLVHSPDIGDALLIDILERLGPGHAKAAARRETLSAPVIAALVKLGNPSVWRTLGLRNLLPANAPAPDETDASQRAELEDKLRNQLRVLAMRRNPQAFAEDGAAPARIAPDMEQRLVHYAENGEALYFTTALSDALSSSFELAERIMLDVSGRQLAETLVALGLRYTLIVVALERFFPHLAQDEDGARRSLRILRACSFTDCVERIGTWQRADRITAKAPHNPVTVDLPGVRERRQAAGRSEDQAKRGSLRRA